MQRTAGLPSASTTGSVSQRRATNCDSASPQGHGDGHSRPPAVRRDAGPHLAQRQQAHTQLAAAKKVCTKLFFGRRSILQRRPLLDHLAPVHQRRVVRQTQRFVNIMGHQHNRPSPDRCAASPAAAPRGSPGRGRRRAHPSTAPPICRQRPRHPHPLLLAAGELMRGKRSRSVASSPSSAISSSIRSAILARGHLCSCGTVAIFCATVQWETGRWTGWHSPSAAAGSGPAAGECPRRQSEWCPGPAPADG